MIAAKFPHYSFEQLYDKSPLWIAWAAKQAAEIEAELLKTIGSVLGVKFDEPKEDNRSDAEKLTGFGIPVLRG